MTNSAKKIEASGHADEILQLAARGKSARDIEDHLFSTYEYKVSHATITKFIKSVRDERSEATKSVIQEHVAATVPSDLDYLHELVLDMRDMYKDQMVRDGDKVAAGRLMMQAVDTLLKYSGAAEPQAVAVTLKMYDFAYSDDEEESD